MKSTYSLIVGMLMALGFTSPFEVSAACIHEDIEAQLIVDAEGKGVLCVNQRGVQARVTVRNLVPDDAYTVWWVYFDDPTQCEVPGVCGGPADFAGANPLGVFGRMDSSLAPPNGKLRLSGRIGGFTPSSGAQLWLWLFGHGPADVADGRHLARQLLTPEDPTAGAPHLGNLIDGPLGFPAAVVMFDLP